LGTAGGSIGVQHGKALTRIRWGGK